MGNVTAIYKELKDTNIPKQAKIDACKPVKSKGGANQRYWGLIQELYGLNDETVDRLKHIRNRHMKRLEERRNNGKDRQRRRMYQGIPEGTDLHRDCDICGRECGTNKKAHHIDHCHDTGEFRGILCLLCNTTLGVYEKALREGRVMDFNSYINKS